MKTVDESGMSFGPFQPSNIFEPEKSQTYTKIKDHVKIADLIVYDHGKNKVLIIEAKSSFPNPENPSSTERFDEEVDFIHQKFVNGLTLTLSILGKRFHEKNEIHSNFNSINLSAIDIHFILVVNGHQYDWITQVDDAIKQKMTPLLKTLNREKSKTFAINDDFARTIGLII